MSRAQFVYIGLTPSQQIIVLGPESSETFLRLTETSDVRITEDGEYRALEGVSNGQ